MMNQRSSNEKQTNMYGTRLQVEVVSRPEGAEDQIYRIYTADMRLCPTYKMASQTPKRHIGIAKNLKNLLISSSSLGSIAISISVS